MKSRSSHVVMFLLLACLRNSADAASPTPTRDQQRIRVLVQLLASKNIVSGKSLQQFPKGYDVKAQVVVYLAIQQLLAEGSTGFDTLIEHFNDTRYSYTYAASDDNYNMTVGNACSAIMVQCIKCYSHQIHIITSEQGDLAPDFNKKEDLANWWKRNRHRPLWDIQVDAIDHAIALMETVSRDKARIPFWLATELSPQVFETRRKDNLRILKELRASIVSQKEAYRPKSLEKWLDEPFDDMIGLPWPTNPHRP